MRIVLVNWARIWDGASNGGGVNGYCQSLALALRDRGHEVVSLFGGTTFVPDPPDCFVRRHDDWLGIRVFEVVNSPVIAPSILQFRRPLGEISAPELERQVGRLLDLIGPDVVHFHNIEGFSAGCVDEARRAVRAGGRRGRVLFSLHNYHTICPQVYLMQGHRRACHDFDNGHSCAGCVATKDPDAERLQRARAYEKLVRTNPGALHVAGAVPLLVAAGAPPAPETPNELRAAIGQFNRAFGWPVHAARATLRLARALMRGAARPEAVLPLPGHPVESADDASRPTPVPARPPPTAEAPDAPAEPDDPSAPPREPLCDDTRGETARLLAEASPPVKPRDVAPQLPERRPLLNIIRPEPPSHKPPNDYARRREAMVRMLNSCDAVLAVSDFVRAKFESMGVDPAVIRTMHIGSRINRVVSLASELVFDPPAHEPARPRPIRVVFMGYNNYYKGLHVLAEALDLLPPETLSCIDLSIFALDGHTIEWVFRRLEPRLAKLTFVCGYKYHDIPWMLGGKDLGVVCSVWWDNAPQTVFEFFACRVPVLGAEVGGIPDFVREGVNGLLFRGNDGADLARRLTEVVQNPTVLNDLRRHVRPPKDIEANTAELEAVYAPAPAPVVVRPSAAEPSRGQA